jgi:beta-lactamase class A
VLLAKVEISPHEARRVAMGWIKQVYHLFRQWVLTKQRTQRTIRDAVRRQEWRQFRDDLTGHRATAKLKIVILRRATIAS